MSRENVEIMRRFYEAWFRRDPSEIGTLDPDIELHPDPQNEWVGLNAVYRGPEGVRDYIRTVEEAVEDYHPEVERLIDAGDQVVTLAVESGRGRGSGAEVQSTRTAHVWTLRDGKAIRLDLYNDRADAYKAVGLEEEEAMSRENVDIVRRGIEAAIRRPEPDFATMNELYHPDHEFISALDALEGQKHRGAPGYRDWQLNIKDTIETESRLEQITEIDTDRVLAIIPTSIRGKSSGVALKEERWACIVTVRGGNIIRSEVYRSSEHALKAAGLVG